MFVVGYFVVVFVVEAVGDGGVVVIVIGKWQCARDMVWHWS